MGSVGYARLVEMLSLKVRELAKRSFISSTVAKKEDRQGSTLFPTAVTVVDTPVGQLEFALRHEDINMEVIAATVEKINPIELIDRLKQSPNGEYIRKACFFWEWLSGQKLDAGVAPTGKYIDLLSSDDFFVAKNPEKNSAFRLNNNVLGNPNFCPVVHRNAIPGAELLQELLQSVNSTIEDIGDEDIYQRAIRYFYLAETRSNFAIEREIPNAKREELFIGLLRRANKNQFLSEDWLVELQNAVVSTPYFKAASYRLDQNRLNSDYLVEYFPPSPDDLRLLMSGWEEFANDTSKEIDPLVKAACVSFGFVYLHPFDDGNGRLHRFLIHQMIAKTGLLPNDVVLPVSAVIQKKMFGEYEKVLQGYSRPVMDLWDYRWLGQETPPVVLESANSFSYSYWNADNEVAFLHKAIKNTIDFEIPNEISFLKKYDRAFNEINQSFDLPSTVISTLIRQISSYDMQLSNRRRKQYADQIPIEILDEIERIVKESFSDDDGDAPPSP